MPHFAALSAPLSNLTRKGQPEKIQWNRECEDAFKNIQTILSNKPILMLPDLNLQFILRTDASDSGLGECLLQNHDGILHPVMFASRKLLPRECRYSIIEREYLSIVWSVSKFSRYLHGAKFIIQTDHKPLKFLKENRSVSMRLSRWDLALQAFHFQIEAIPGVLNGTADVLSRLC